MVKCKILKVFGVETSISLLNLFRALILLHYNINSIEKTLKDENILNFKLI